VNQLAKQNLSTRKNRTKEAISKILAADWLRATASYVRFYFHKIEEK
jgi:hypothetical protein